MARSTFRYPNALLGLYLAVALIIAIGGVSFYTIRRESEADQRVTLTGDVQQALKQVLTQMLDAETGQRGYIITGDASFLKPYTEATSKPTANLNKLKELTGDNAVQQANIGRLEKLYNAKFDELERVRFLRETQGFDAAQKAVKSGVGKKYMDEARDVIAAMEKVEKDLLNERKRTSTISATVSSLVIFGGSGLLFMLVAASTFALQRALREQQILTDDLAESEERLGVTLQSIGDALMATDKEGRITFMNPVAEKLTGWTAAEAKGRPSREIFQIVNEDSRNEVASPVEEAIRENRIVELANHTILIAKDGTEHFIDDSGAPIRDRSGKLIGAILVFRDITTRKLARKAVDDLNVRLRRAMAETHHRVKNNLQVISALIEMQVPVNKATIPAESLLRIRQHITSLAAIHDLLTQEAAQEGELDFVQTEAIFSRLQSLLISVAGTHTLHFTIENMRVPVRQGTSLSILVNELISNAIKHGDGDIAVSLTQAGENGRLEVRDHGAGFPPDFDPKQAANTGLKLIDSLGHWDMKGEVTFQNHPNGGASIVIVFPLFIEQAGY